MTSTLPTGTWYAAYPRGAAVRRSQTAAEGWLRHGAGPLPRDLGEVPFCDAAGLAVLIGVMRRTTGFGITLRLAAPRPAEAASARHRAADTAN